MKYAEFSEIVNHNVKILLPSISTHIKRLGIDHRLPDISPREHRLIIQSPSLFKSSYRPKESQQSVKDAIERSLNKFRSGKYENCNVGPDFIEKKPTYEKMRKNNAKLEPKKITTYKRFISGKAIKSRENCNRTPISHKKSLIILSSDGSKTPQTQRNSSFSKIKQKNPERKDESESDEDKVDYQAQFDYLDMIKQ
jgi:hypothetical protein